MQRILSKLVGTQNDRAIKRILPQIERINQLEASLVGLSDAQLSARTGDFRVRLENGEPVDALLPEAFATVREASKRTLGQRHYDMQLVGGIVLHNGMIAEMKTGEGKTLVATLPCYLNGLTGAGVHVVTTNDFLAKRDAEWMGEVHRFLGLTVGSIVHGLDDQGRREAYGADITYCTNNELGFDYLRDNMKYSVEQFVQRDLHYAIIDEVDSILIDEARTPLIISGPSEANTQVYSAANRVIPLLNQGVQGDPAKGVAETGDYWIDEKTQNATLTEEGIHKVEKALRVDNLFDPSMMPVIHSVNQALVAHALKKSDVDYVVRRAEDGGKEVVIVDEHTGRMMPGRRWADGLHQAVEAKEGIQIRSENQTLAEVTYQNFFRMYGKLSGMTGTADTEAQEFANIYNLEVSLIPSNRPLLRADLADVVFKTKTEKFGAVIDEIQERHEHGQPVLVGTISIETSEMLSKKLKKRGIKHEVLNAKKHARESEIVSLAGRKGAITISTNMAGRGTDIMLGGNPETMAFVKCGHDKDHPDYPNQLASFEAQCAAEQKEVLESGGLHILGTERHESRRIDNQLRGRSGRQGDPGSSQFFLSLEDDLLRIFEADRVAQWWDRVGVQEGEAIENRMLTRVIEGAQKKVESRNFDIRKHLLEYDDVKNKQRQAFYSRRLQALHQEGVSDEVKEMVEGQLVHILQEVWPEKGPPEDEDLHRLVGMIEHQFGLLLDTDAPPIKSESGSELDRDEVGRAILELFDQLLLEKRKACDAMVEEYRGTFDYPEFDWFERDILLRILDAQWKDHLRSMESLREAIGLRGYAQKDPKVEYQREGFALFGEMEERVDEQVVETVFKFGFPRPRLESTAQTAASSASAAPRPRSTTAGGGNAGQPGMMGPGAGPGASSSAADQPKVGRNDACPCGSGKKYKRCHGA